MDSGTVLDDNTPDLLTSGSGRGHLHADAQTLAMMLQEQLDVINNEIRFVSVTFVACHVPVIVLCDNIACLGHDIT